MSRPSRLQQALISTEDFVFMPSVTWLLGAACRRCCRGYGLVCVACGVIAVRACVFVLYRALQEEEARKKAEEEELKRRQV